MDKKPYRITITGDDYAWGTLMLTDEEAKFLSDCLNKENWKDADQSGQFINSVFLAPIEEKKETPTIDEDSEVVVSYSDGDISQSIF